MTTKPPKSDGIPPKMVDRYRKLQAMADVESGATANERVSAEKHLEKLRKRFPSIGKAVDVIEEREQRRAAARGETWHPPEPTQAEWEELIPDVVLRVGGLLGRDIVEDARNVFGWAIEQLKEASQAAIESAYDAGENIQTGDLMTLREQLEKEMGIEIEEDEAENGEELIIVTLEVPVALWDKILGQKNGPKSLVDAIRNLDTDEEGEEGD
jgi:hypothetical protein